MSSKAVSPARRQVIHPRRLSAVLLGLSIVTTELSSPALAAGQPQSLATRYASAERFLYDNADRYLRNGIVKHHWVPGQDRLWYRRSTGPETAEFVIVDAATGKREPAFDHARVAAALAVKLGKPVDAAALPFTSFRYAQQGRAIEFLVEDKLWNCHTDGSVCGDQGTLPGGKGTVVSPDGRWIAFLKDHDLWVRASDGSTEFALTSDGQEHYAYAASPGSNTHAVTSRRYGVPPTPQVIWSPDSRKLLTHRLDERKVKELHLLQSTPEDGSLRPKLHTMRYAMANDEHKALVEQLVFDVASRKRTTLQNPPLPSGYVSIIEDHLTWWANDGKRVYFFDYGPYYRNVKLKVADAVTGATRTLIEESSDAFIEVAEIAQPAIMKVLSNGDFIWFSERDGWGHLYLHDGRTGKLKNRITQGEWRVRGIARVDERAGTIHFVANGREPGRDPYFRHLYRIGLDGSNLTLLTPEDAEHQVNIAGDMQSMVAGADPLAAPGEMLAFSPSGRYFVNTYSRPDLPTTVVLRKVDGTVVGTLETADLSLLKAGGYTLPERFRALAADGKTPIYGNIHRPSDFDPKKKYAVVDAVYPGPQIVRAMTDFRMALFDPLGAQAVAELGFVVITVDGRGTPMRSREFLNHVNGKLGIAGHLDDHIAAMRQLAQKRPYMDLERVGVFGQSGGGFAAARAILEYPDFYKVAVAAAGNHDQRGYIPVWGETYNGADDGKNYLHAANSPLAGNLRGKLLLMHGEMDDNVHPALTLQLCAALIAANKDFDQLILPNVHHGIMENPYALRRTWDYLVRHLQAVEPPAGYAIQTGAVSKDKQQVTTTE